MLPTLALAVLLAAGAAPPPLPRDVHGDPLPPGVVARLGTLRFRSREGFRNLVFLRDPQRLLALGPAGNGQIREWPSGRQIRRWSASPLEVGDLFPAPDGRRIAATLARGTEVAVWEPGTEKHLSLTGHPTLRVPERLA